MDELTSGILTPRKIVDYKGVHLSVYSVDDALFWWDAWKSGRCIGQSPAKVICLTEDRCLENAMRWVDAFIFCDEDGVVPVESAKDNSEKHTAVRSGQDVVVNVQEAISIAKKALTWMCGDCFREKIPFFTKEVSRTADRMYWAVQVYWVGKGDEMRLSKELTIEAETGEVVGIKNYDTI